MRPLHLVKHCVDSLHVKCMQSCDFRVAVAPCIFPWCHCELISARTGNQRSTERVGLVQKCSGIDRD